MTKRHWCGAPSKLIARLARLFTVQQFEDAILGLVTEQKRKCLFAFF
jgi:hypothetical protein